MGFDSGRMSFRLAEVLGTLKPEEVVLAMRGRGLTEKRPDATAYYQGWTAPACALDGDLTGQKCVVGSVVRAALVAVQRKAPAKLLAARVAQAVQARKQALAVDRLSKRETREIKKDVLVAMLPEMPECIGEIPVALVGADSALLGATSDRQMDALAIEWMATFSDRLRMRVLDWRAVCDMAEVHAEEIAPVQWAPGRRAADAMDDAAADFLTWLLLRTLDPEHKSNPKLACSPDDGAIELVGEGPRAKKITISKGAALSSELMAALRAGKKAAELGLILAMNEWEPVSLRVNRGLVFKAVGQPLNVKNQEARFYAARDVAAGVVALAKDYLRLRKKPKDFDAFLTRVQTADLPTGNR